MNGLRGALEAASDVEVVPLAWGGAGRLTAVARDVAWYPVLLPAQRRPGRRRRAPLHDLPRARPRARVPTIVTVHDLAVLRHPEAFPLWTRLYGALRPAADDPRRRPRRRRLGVLASARSSSSLGVDPDRIDVVPNGVEPVFTPGRSGGRGRLRARRRHGRAAQEPRARDRGGAACAGVELRVVGDPGWGGVEVAGAT